MLMKRKCSVAAVVFLVLTICCVGMATAQEKPAGVQSGFSKMDADGNGEITIVEHGAFWKGRFNDIDANKDGRISADEFVEGVIKHTFENAATSENKVLLAQEYVVYWCGPDAKAPKKAKGKAKVNVVADVDVNKNGKVDKDECSALWLTHFNNIDADKDGKVTKDEFVTYLKKRFKELDRNGDGYIVMAEYDYYWSGKPASVKK
jgi:Ca2+-binding EF-hand superfamily protein